MIHVAYRLWGGDGFYAKMLGTSMLSIFENTNEKVTVHIMHNDRLTPDNRGKFCYIAGQYHQQVQFHNVEEIAGGSLRQFEAAHPMKSGINAAWYPLITHEVFPDLDKIIFLGSDTVFNIDINELWKIELDDKFPFGAISEYFIKKSVVNPICQDGYVKHEDYFNTDVMMFNPNFFRENFDEILEACKFVNRNRQKYLNAENDALCMFCYKNYTRLPANFNVMVNHLRIHTSLDNYRLEKAIYHYSDSFYRPTLNTDDILNRLYLEYFLKTPWATVDMFGNIDKALKKTFGQFFNSSRETLLHLTNLLAERRRAFFVDKRLLPSAKQIFKIKDTEAVIDSSVGEEKLLQEMSAAEEQKILFIFATNYQQIRSLLLAKDFVEGVDFLNAFIFLSARHGIKSDFDTKPLVQEL